MLQAYLKIKLAVSPKTAHEKDKYLLSDTNVHKTAGQVSLRVWIVSTVTQKLPQSAVTMAMLYQSNVASDNNSKTFFSYIHAPPR